MYNYYDFEAEFPLEKAVQKYLVSDYFHDSKICSVKMDHSRRELIICLQCCREWEESGVGTLDDPRYSYSLRFNGVYGFLCDTGLSLSEYINGRFKRTAWLEEQQKRTRRKLYQFRIGLADGYLDIVFSRFSVRKGEGRVSYSGITELGAFYKSFYKRSPEQLDEIREDLKNSSADALIDDLNLAFLYANEAEDLSLQCRRILMGESSQAAQVYAAWLLGKCGSCDDLPLIWNAISTEKARESYDYGSDNSMKYRNLFDAVELLSK